MLLHCENVPQGLKPSIICGLFVTTKVVPFHKAIFETGSKSVQRAFFARHAYPASVARLR